jgi:hypothetical protein
MSTKIQIRRDTASAWTSANPALAAGEIGYETDTRNIKIGDGTTLWSSLKYQAPYYTAANSGAPNTLLALDVGNSRVGIGNSSPATTLDVTGQVRVRGGSSYSEPSDNASVINYDNTGGILTVDARSGGGTTNIVFRASTSGTGGERVRIRPSGNVLETNGIVTSNRTTAGTFVVSGDGAYAFGTDTKQYIYGKPGNDGNVAIYTTTAAGVSNDRLNVTSTAVQVKTALTTTSTATIGDALTVSTGGATITAGGLTVTAGGATVTAGGLTVSAGTVSLPAGSIAGTALADSGVTKAKLSAITRIAVTAYYSGSGNFTVPAGVTSLKVTAVGGGGGGGSQNPGGAGGSGVCATAIYSVTAGASYAYAVGAGGTGATYGTSNGSGTAGGATTFLSMSAGGGTAGAAGVAGSVGTYALTAAPAGTSILADFRPGVQGISGVKRDNLVAGNPALTFVVGATYPPGTGGDGSTTNGATSSSGNAASGGVGGMLVIEYNDMA